MNWKTLALGCAIAGVGVVGCGTSTNPPGTDTGGGGNVDTGVPPMTRTYILAALDSGETLPTDPPTAYGFNLDNMEGGPTGTCQDQADAVSPSGMMGVDNVLATVLPTLAGLAGSGGTANDLLNDQVRAGAVLLIIQVSDINSFTNDSSVMVQTRLATLPNTMTCTGHADMASCTADTANNCNWYAGGAGACIPMMVDANGAIAAGQTFGMGMALGPAVTGDITMGRINVTASTLPLSFDISGTAVMIELNNLHITGRITDTSIANGEFGASLAVDELVRVAMGTSIAMGMTAEEIRALLETFVTPDLEPDATGMTCNSISAGFGFNGVTATIN